jgi:hypothetical protein
VSDRVVIDGDVSLTSTIDGEGNAFIRLGQNPIIEPLEVTENGTYEVPDGVEGFNPVTVNVGTFWKSVTLEEDHIVAPIGSPVYWFKFLGIPREDIQNGWIYEVYVENNKIEYYYVRWLRYALKPNVGDDDNGIHSIYVRGQSAVVFNKPNYGLYAVKGAVFNVYRYKIA